jgi:predicted enzyme related to lactoylglutathione lyase
MANPVVHFEVIGTDGARLQRFYGEVFAWEIDANNPMNYGMVRGSEHEIGGGIGGGDQGQGVTFYVEVPSLEDALSRIEERGGKTVVPPSDVPGGPRMAQFEDPEGNRIGLVQAGSMQQQQGASGEAAQQQKPG